MKRRYWIPTLAIAFAMVMPSTQPPVGAQQAVELRIATLAPEGSSWMRVFNAWNNSLKEKTGNKVSLRFYPGGSQGDERDFIRKIRAGQMDGAAVTGTGLGMVERSVLVLGVPGIFNEYSQIDKARRRLSKSFDKKFDKAGFKLMGWSDVGKARLFSTKKIVKPSDLRSSRPWAWKDDKIWSKFLSVVGANPVRLGVPEVYPALQTKMVDTVPASALAAVSLQWFTRLKYVSKQTNGIIIGATILKKDKVDALTPDQQTALMETSKRAHKALTRAIRRDDKKAYKTILKRGVKEMDFAPHAAEWAEAAKKTREGLAGRVFSKKLLERVEAAAQ